MRQGCEVPGGADRALRRDEWIDLMLEQRCQRFDELESHAGIAAGEGVDLQRQHEPHHRVGQRLAHAGGMREKEVSLQQLQLIRGNAGLRQQSKTRVDAIGRIALGDDPIHQRIGRHDSLAVRRSNADERRLRMDAAQAGEAQLAGDQGDNIAHLSVAHLEGARSSVGSSPALPRSRSRSDTRRPHDASRPCRDHSTARAGFDGERRPSRRSR